MGWGWVSSGSSWSVEPFGVPVGAAPVSPLLNERWASGSVFLTPQTVKPKVLLA